VPISFRAGPVSVRTPATSANLGPGFDALGLALTLYDEVTAEVVTGETTVEVCGEGAGSLATNEDHLIVHAMRKTFDRLGGQPEAIRLRCVNRIPQARGLGSSSAAIVAGVTVAQALAGTKDLTAALEIAGELEGHPDNVAPCILGGFTIAWLSHGAGVADGGAPSAKAVRLIPHPGVKPVVFVPQTQGFTAAARAALPREVPHRDASFNAGRSALLVHALTQDPSLLLEATEDRLHQGYRAPGMPETAALVKQLREQGVAAVVSGAGPAVLALAITDEMPHIGTNFRWTRHNLVFDLAGAALVE
jgi:homoserine kinase